MPKKENEMFTKMTSHANYEEIVNVFSAMIAKMFRNYLLTDEKQSEFIESLMLFKTMNMEGEEDE